MAENQTVENTKEDKELADLLDSKIYRKYYIICYKYFMQLVLYKLRIYSMISVSIVNCRINSSKVILNNE